MKITSRPSLLFVSAAAGLSAVAGIGACGKSVPDTINGLGEAVQSSEIQHKWVEANCAQPGAMKILGGSKRKSIQFATNEIRISDQYFSDDACLTPAVLVEYTGRFDKKALAIQPDIYQLDIQLTGAQVTPQNETGRNLLNSVPLCEKNDWIVLTPTNMSERTRGALCPLENLPQTSYNVYAVRGSLLYLGKGDAQLKESDRPVELNIDQAFHVVP